MTRIDKFMEEYTRQLTLDVEKYPEEYSYSVEEVPEVAAYWKEYFLDRTYNKDSRAIKATCAVLGIPHTYNGIHDYLSGKDVQRPRDAYVLERKFSPLFGPDRTDKVKVYPADKGLEAVEEMKAKVIANKCLMTEYQLVYVVDYYPETSSEQRAAAA